jgi:hypothetical protein
MLFYASLFTLVYFQAYIFAVALYYHSTGPASVINARINDFAITAVTQLTTYLGM